MTEESIEEQEVEVYEASWEIDSVYEFDALQFFDFTRPESASDDEKAERWFQVAGYHPPSPFFYKLNLENIIPIEEAKTHESPMSKDCISTQISSSNEKIMRDTPKSKSKSTPKSYKPRSSTLMKPTASQFARQNHARHDHNESTKRQKLETGYVSKVAQLKHQASLLHKSSKTGGSPAAKTSHSKLNVTVPREPNLETRRRAQWRRFRSKNVLDSSEHVTKEPNATFKAKSLNNKVLESLSSTPQHKKSTRRSPMSQESKCSNDGKLLQHPPIELFSKLSLKSDMDAGAVSQQPKHHPFAKVKLYK